MKMTAFLRPVAKGLTALSVVLMIGSSVFAESGSIVRTFHCGVAEIKVTVPSPNSNLKFTFAELTVLSNPKIPNVSLEPIDCRKASSEGNSFSGGQCYSSKSFLFHVNDMRATLMIKNRDGVSLAQCQLKSDAF